LVVAVGVEGRVDVDQVDAGVGELFQLVEVVAAVDDAGVEEGGEAAGWGGRGASACCRWNERGFSFQRTHSRGRLCCIGLGGFGHVARVSVWRGNIKKR